MSKFKLLLILLLSVSGVTFACTTFGYITKKGTIIAKNRDERYAFTQSFDLVFPTSQFDGWMDNTYDHHYRFYAVMANHDVKMGINQEGLTTIEEAPLAPNNSRRYIQPVLGYSEGLTMWGILQNFKSVDEILPYLTPIFSHAAPNYYQIADGHKILTVEVAFADDDKYPTRKFSYKVLDQEKELFTHTNYYLDPQFAAQNFIPEFVKKHPDVYKGTFNRNQTIMHSLATRESESLDTLDKFFMDFKSDVGGSSPNWCLNTSIFRSHLQVASQAYSGMEDQHIFGTVSSLMVENTNDPKTTQIRLKIIDRVKLLSNGDQQIKYRSLQINLAKLFSKNPNLQYVEHSVIRKKPKAEICR